MTAETRFLFLLKLPGLMKFLYSCLVPLGAKLHGIRI